MILEPDPLARALSRRRFLGLTVVSERLDCLAGPHGAAMLQACFPQAAWLFANLLGQFVAELDPQRPQALLA